MEYAKKDLLDKSGFIFWICDYRYRDVRDKPIRAVTPVRAVLITSESKWRHEPDLEFTILRKDGKPSTRKINYRDNVAWGSENLKVFDTEEECRARFREQAEQVFKELDEYEKQELARIEEQRQRLREALK